MSTQSPTHAITFENADHADNDPFIGVDVHGKMDTMKYFARPLNLFHAVDDDFERKELAQFVRYVEWRVIENIPSNNTFDTIRYHSTGWPKNSKPLLNHQWIVIKSH